MNAVARYEETMEIVKNAGLDLLHSKMIAYLHTIANLDYNIQRGGIVKISSGGVVDTATLVHRTTMNDLDSMLVKGFRPLNDAVREVEGVHKDGICTFGASVDHETQLVKLRAWAKEISEGLYEKGNDGFKPEVTAEVLAEPLVA